MSRTREEKLSEDLPEDSRQDIIDQYDRIDLVENLEPNDIMLVETALDIMFVGEVVNVHERGQHTVDLDVLAYDGPDHAYDDSAFIVIDRAGAEGSLHEWKGVPYTHAFPEVGHQDTWGDLREIETADDADDVIDEVINE